MGRPQTAGLCQRDAPEAGAAALGTPGAALAAGAGTGAGATAPGICAAPVGGGPLAAGAVEAGWSSTLPPPVPGRIMFWLAR